ncbi:uncharacterized protein TNCV_1834081 [Trichonephila clavipes]|nr:uncharacterized protein TNCV_1834081 [Trichonephila clavipes]
MGSIHDAHIIKRKKACLETNKRIPWLKRIVMLLHLSFEPSPTLNINLGLNLKFQRSGGPRPTIAGMKAGIQDPHSYLNVAESLTEISRLKSSHIKSLSFCGDRKNFALCTKCKTPQITSWTIWDFRGRTFFPLPSWYRSLSWHYFPRWRRFVEWAQNEIAVVPDFHKRILFSDEAHFWLNGYVKKQNCRIWSEANPQVYVETLLHPKKLTVWCALWAGGIIGPYFFKNDEGHNVTVNGDRYRAMITNFFIPELNNHDVQELWFQQDGATCHTARATIDLLKDTFGDRLISRFGPVNWPPRSCDLTPLDYLLWGYVKSLWSMRISHKRLTLWKTTSAVLLPIYGHKCWKKSSKIGRPDWTTSEPAVAVLCQKSYLKCNATRLSFE